MAESPQNALKALTQTFFSTWNLDEAEFISKVIQIVSDPKSVVADIDFLKEDIAPRKQAAFLEALSAYHTDAIELTKSASGRVNPDEVKANIKKLTLAFFSTWGLDETEFLEKTLQIFSDPNCVPADLDFLKEDIAPRKQASFLQSLTALHGEVLAELARLNVGEEEDTREPDPPFFEAAPTECVHPDTLADTGIPFYLKSESDYYISLNRMYLHALYGTSSPPQINSYQWDELSPDPDSFLLARWLLRKVKNSTYYTLSPWFSPELCIDNHAVTRRQLEGPVDFLFQFKIEPSETENGFFITFLQEQARLTAGNAYGHTTICTIPSSYEYKETKRTIWKFFKSPCTLRRRIPEIEKFVDTQIPFLLSANSGGLTIFKRDDRYEATNNYDQQKTQFTLVKALWDGKPGYRLISTTTGKALSWAPGWGEREISNRDQGLTDAHPGQFDARSFIQLEPSCAPGLLNINFPQLDACLSSQSGNVYTNNRQFTSSGNADQQSQAFMFMPYSLNPSDWPSDPSLNQITFAFRWGSTQYSDQLFIGPEELPLAPGTKLVLVQWSSRPGIRWIIQPVKDQPKQFRLVSADDRKLCMCVKSLEDPVVTLTDQRDENTLLTCELNSCGVWNNAAHHYKFVCSNLYLGVRPKTHKTNIGADVIQAVKDVQNSHEKTAFRLVNGGITVDMTKQPNGNIRQIYSKLHPPTILRCVCHSSFEKKSDLTYHQTICPAYSAVPRKCQYCTGYVLENGPGPWIEHGKTCIKNAREASPNQCLTCMAIYSSPDTLKAHKCPGVRVPDIEVHVSRAKYLYPPHYDVVKPKQVDSATASANKKKVESSRSGCATTACQSDIQVCSTCKKEKGVSCCLFCGSPKEIERVKCCEKCSVKEGGGNGKITGKADSSVCCIHCGTQGGPQNAMSVYHICYQCKTLYGHKCYYNYCLGLENIPK